MSTSEMKQTRLGLIAWIKQLSDNHMLSFLESLKNSGSETDWWDTLNEDTINRIKQGIEDADNGRMVSSQELWEKLKDA